ncbi:MAG: glutaredoxin family protein [Actinomycetes bacterium]
MADGVRVVLLGRPGCHLCADAREVVRRVADDTGVAWVERSVDDDETLAREYGELVPVVLVDGRRHAWWRVDEQRLREALTAPAEGPAGASSWVRRWRRTP